MSPPSSHAETQAKPLSAASRVTLQHNIAVSMADCLSALRENGSPIKAPPGATVPWCNATWDTVLCWPATAANTSTSLPCPPLKGLDPEKHLQKVCDVNGQWLGRFPGVQSTTPHGWTNFTQCFTDEVLIMMKELQGNVATAQAIAKTARKLEFVGLGLSFASLSLCIFIFAYFRRLRSFRNMLHLQLMTAILMVVIIRLVLYIDLIFTDRLGSMQTLSVGLTINTMTVVCESMYLLLEYFKTVAFAWMFLEGWYLHNTLVFTVFNTEPRIRDFMLVGYGAPMGHTALWFAAVLLKRGSVERCLGSYYLEPEFWILDGPRMLELCINFLFICNVIRVLWSKVRDSHDTSEVERMRKSVKAALMLIPLLGIPNIMQTIPFTPTSQNIVIFAVWTYLASFTYMFQGFMVATLYCFTNKEVINVIKMSWGRYQLQHSTAEGLRRPSSKPSTVAHYNTHIDRGGGAAGGGTSSTAGDTLLSGLNHHHGMSGGRNGSDVERNGAQLGSAVGRSSGTPNGDSVETSEGEKRCRGQGADKERAGSLEPPHYDSIVSNSRYRPASLSPQSARAVMGYRKIPKPRLPPSAYGDEEDSGDTSHGADCGGTNRGYTSVPVICDDAAAGDQQRATEAERRRQRLHHELVPLTFGDTDDAATMAAADNDVSVGKPTSVRFVDSNDVTL